MNWRDREIIRELNADRWAEEDAAAEEDQRLSREVARGHFGSSVYDALTRHGERFRGHRRSAVPGGPALSQIRDGVDAELNWQPVTMGAAFQKKGRNQDDQT